MDQGPLVTEQIEAGAKLAHDFDEQYQRLSAAYWLKEPDDDQRFLHLVSDQIDDSKIRLAYGEVLRLLGPGPHTWLNPFQVKVEATNHPVARSVMEIQQKYPGSLATPLRDPYLGGRLMDEVYIYPLASLVTH